MDSHHRLSLLITSYSLSVKDLRHLMLEPRGMRIAMSRQVRRPPRGHHQGDLSSDPSVPGVPAQPGRRDPIIVKAVSAELIPEAMEQITSLLRERHRIRPGQPDAFHIRDMAEITQAKASTSKLMGDPFQESGLIPGTFLANSRRCSGERGIRSSLHSNMSSENLCNSLPDKANIIEHKLLSALPKHHPAARCFRFPRSVAYTIEMLVMPMVYGQIPAAAL